MMDDACRMPKNFPACQLLEGLGQILGPPEGIVMRKGAAVMGIAADPLVMIKAKRGRNYST